jgi:hypothetical protein
METMTLVQVLTTVEDISRVETKPKVDLWERVITANPSWLILFIILVAVVPCGDEHVRRRRKE